MRVKMHCNSVSHYGPAKSDPPAPTDHDECEIVRLVPATGQTHIAERGEIVLTIVNPEAFGHFTQNAFYHVDFFETQKDAE